MSVAVSIHRPTWMAWLLLLTVAAGLLALAYWQYQRGLEKADFIAQKSARAVTEALSWDQADAPLDDIVNRPIRLRGHFLPAHTLALDNQIRHGKVGVELLMLFQPDASEQRVLVNLGWVPSDRNGGPALPVARPADGELRGIIHKPSAFITLGGPENRAGIWRVGRVEPAYWATQWQQPIVPWVLRLDASIMGGYVRDWSSTSAQRIGPERHRAYAFQWASLALAWCGCWYGFWRKGLHHKDLKQL